MYNYYFYDSLKLSKHPFFEGAVYDKSHFYEMT